jgi:hypothetical protein
MMNLTFKRLATRLLTTTCLTAAASAVALGGTIVEPAGGFGSTFPGTLLPAGTTQVTGTATKNNGGDDFFELQGLPGGASLSSLSFLFQNNSSNFSLGVIVLSDTDAVVTAFDGVDPNTSYSPVGIVPVDGNVVIDLQPANEAGTPYVFTLAQSAPEPGTFAALGLGLAGLGSLALRRRRKS